jgi:hypothetical protein
MPADLFPGFIRVDYITPYAPHVMVLPVNTPVIDTGDPVSSTITAWDAGQRDWVDMASDLITEIADAYATTVNFNRVTLFNKPDPDEDAVFIASEAIDIDGTVATPDWYQATQLTINAKDGENKIAKLVLLDFASGGLFTKTLSLTGSGLEAIWGQWAAVTNGWSSRNGKRPSTFISATRTLNEKLRRNYHLA